MLNKSSLHVLTATALLIAIGCSDNSGLRVPPDGGRAGVGGSASPDTFATGGSGGTWDGHSGGAPGTGGMRPDAGVGGVGGRSTLLGGPDAAPAGGTGGMSGVGGTGGGNADQVGVCSEAPCLAALFLPCQPEGTCTSDDVTGPLTSNQSSTYCYPNSVKQQVVTTFDGNVLTARFTEKRNSQACFVIDVSMKLPEGTAAYVFRDGDGQQVGTGTSLTNSDVLTVTCDGSAPVLLSQGCLDTASVGSSCNTGACTF